MKLNKTEWQILQTIVKNSHATHQTTGLVKRTNTNTGTTTTRGLRIQKAVQGLFEKGLITGDTRRGQHYEYSGDLCSGTQYDIRTTTYHLRRVLDKHADVWSTAYAKMRHSRDVAISRGECHYQGYKY